MKVEPGRVRAPEIGRVWLNSPPLNLRQLRGKVVLIDFWDYTCANCIRTLPYVQFWHERYREQGLVVIGVHTPEFTFARYESNVERGVREFGLTYPIVVDSNYELWQAFANRCWPAKYLIDKDGYVRLFHYGEGAYHEAETAIRDLLREVQPDLAFPPLMELLRNEDKAGAVCYPASSELYLGHKRGRMGNPQGFAEDASADYSFSGDLEEGVFYVSGRWASTAEYLEAAAGSTRNCISLKYSAAGVNLVMSSNQKSSCDVVILQDGQPLPAAQVTNDSKFRPAKDNPSIPESYVTVDRARMYALADNHAFGTHTLELICPPGLAAFAFTFTSCVQGAAV